MKYYENKINEVCLGHCKSMFFFQPHNDQNMFVLSGVSCSCCLSTAAVDLQTVQTDKCGGGGKGEVCR